MNVIELVNPETEEVVILKPGDRYQVRNNPGSDVWGTRYIFDIVDDMLIVYQNRSDLYTSYKSTLQDLFLIGDLRPGVPEE